MSEFSVAVVGATGLVGQTALEVLESHPEDHFEIHAYATDRSSDSTIAWRDRYLTIETMPPAPPEIDYALFCAPNHVAAKHALAWAKAGVRVIDNSSFFRMHEGIPLVVPEVNARRIGEGGNLVANPNCSTIQLAVALAPLQRRWGVKSVHVSTYQSVSGAGTVAMERWQAEIENRVYYESPFPRPIHGNVIPLIGEIGADGYTREETKMMEELPKILESGPLPVTITCVRVPVGVGHSEAVEVELDGTPALSEVQKALNHAPGIIFEPDPNRVITPKEIAGRPEVFIGRVRAVPHSSSTFLMWVVSDNLRKGAAENAIQIMDVWRTMDEK